MNREKLPGSWKQLKERFHHHWEKLTDEDVDQARGRFDALVAVLQKRYSLAKDEAEASVDAFLAGVGEPDKADSKADQKATAKNDPKGALQADPADGPAANRWPGGTGVGVKTPLIALLLALVVGPGAALAANTPAVDAWITAKAKLELWTSAELHDAEVAAWPRRLPA